MCMQCHGLLRHEVTKKAIKTALQKHALKLCVHVICYIQYELHVSEMAFKIVLEHPSTVFLI